MPAAMQAKKDANSAAAQNAQKAQISMQMNDHKFQQKQDLSNQQANERIQRDLVIASAKASGLSETVEGQPSTGGLEGQQPSVV